MNRISLIFGSTLLAIALPAFATSCPTPPAANVVGDAGAILLAPGYGYYSIINYLYNFGTVSATGINGTSSATVTGGSNPSASASDASAQLTYFLAACGSAGTVALDVTGSVSASAVGQQNSEAFFGMWDTTEYPVFPALISDFLVLLDDRTLNVGGYNTPASFNGVIDVPANDLIEVYLLVGGYATVDPSISLDPSVAGEYTLNFSPGITAGSSGPAVPPVPEPSTMELVALGLIGLGALKSRYG